MSSMKHQQKSREERIKNFILSLVLLFLSGFLQAFDFSPPFRDIEVWTDSNSVRFKVFDPSRGAWKGSLIYSSDPKHLFYGDGVVTFVSDDYNTVQYFTVYDPTRGGWKTGLFYISSNTTIPYLSAPITADGVVANFSYDALYMAAYDPNIGGWKKHILNTLGTYYSTLTIVDGVVVLHANRSVYYAVYDQTRSAWKTVTHDCYPSGISHLMYGNGVVAYKHDGTLYYAVYDPGRGSWKKGNSPWNLGACYSIFMDNGTIIYKKCIDRYWSYIGYDHHPGTWYDGYTKPFACFVASPVWGEGEYWIYFNDMSFSGADIYWFFGDGGGGAGESPAHFYSQEGVFMVTQVVSGPGGSDSTSQDVIIDFEAPAGSITINNGDAETTSTSVSLTLSASDNCSTVAFMRFSNDDSTWSSWEQYATTQSWTLTSGTGTKWVYVQFQDTVGNISQSYSDSIQLVPLTTITVTSPNGGENWQASTIYNITWTCNAMSDNVTIDLYKGGIFDSNIGTAIASSGSFLWDIPSDLTTGDDYQVRIYQGTVEDYSDYEFSVIPKSSFTGAPDFNKDGRADVIWRYDAPEGYNAVWLLGTSGVSSALTGVYSHKITHAGLLAKMNGDTGEGIPQKNAWDSVETDWTVPVKDGFAGQTHWNYNASFAPGPFAVDNKAHQNISRVMASSVSDPSDDPQAVELPAVADQNWKIAGTGDFNGDGKIDIVWSNVSTAHNCVWYMDGTTFAGYGKLPDGSTTDWVLGGVGDFDRDGNPDLIWRNEADGRNGIWYMDGVNLVSVGIMTTGANVDWKLRGTGDFNGDNKVDLVWRNTSDGRNAVWYMDGAELASVGWLDSVEDQNWKLRGTGDFNSDGKTDLIWTNISDGRNCTWYLDGVMLTGVEFLTTVTNTDWKIEN